ncbi:MAG: SIS domain-containing protein [Planctomycetes bacterium]|nr:SIS domain-containing protein [Planctomycetota bacterium]
MCGIIAVLRRRSPRATPERRDIEAPIRSAFAVDLSLDAEKLEPALQAAADRLSQVDRLLRGPAGIRCLIENEELADLLGRELRAFDAKIEALEGDLDRGTRAWSGSQVEAVNRRLIELRDAAWAVHRDRLRTARAVMELAGETRSAAAIEAYAAIQIAMSGLDRLEVRGRDSAGLHVLVENHSLPLDHQDVQAAIAQRSADPLFRSGSVRVSRGGAVLGFVYKRSAEIGELGDNVAAIRAAIRGDRLLRAALSAPQAEVTVLAHTRWASVGIISEPNAHPLDSAEVDRAEQDYVVGVLNGDVDNHVALVREAGLAFPVEITTDAKVIPALVARHMGEGLDRLEAFRRTVASFEGSVAIGVSTAADPGELLLALRGSGQALYVGVTEDAYVVASEPYGVVEECARYLRMDGETPGNPNNPTASRGQIIRLARDEAGSVHGIVRMAYDGTRLPVSSDDLVKSAITTRDVDRGNFPHFLLKEISESPRSFRKTLRGKIVEEQGRLRVRLGHSVLPEDVRTRLRTGVFKRILTIGQGTAAVAGQGVAAALRLALRGSDIAIETMPATELSGFQMRDDMGDTLIVAISQSGTTTDTNRTVDLVRGRGAAVVAIVNRRGSDLTDKADGVLYTSDGRDVEMSVASTKAFYAQIAAGFVLAFAIADEVGCLDLRQSHDLLSALRSMPDAMTEVLSRRAAIAAAARETTRRRYWALVGNGSNLIAAREIRIKLSELCYKSIACDATEDKKHIDLSSEPMILVCAAGLTGSTADDVAKEVAIYRAHKALPIVIADDGEDRFLAAAQVIRVPRVHPSLAFILSTVAGHLFGYECALSIDALARPLREARAAIERIAHGADGHGLLEALAPDLAVAAKAFHEALRDRRLDGSLEAATATQLATLLRYATGVAPLELFPLELGKVVSPAELIEDLTEALTRAIDELTRPVDAIKHQAKTVTVGISRSDESFLGELLVRETLAAGTPREALAWNELRTLAALGPAVAKVVGFSRYEISGDDPDARVHQIASGGVARGMRSRTLDDPRLRGTKHQVARERRLLVARGARDGRTVIIVPEVTESRCSGLILLHVELADHLSANDARSVLSAYRNRFSRLADAVMETEPAFREELLADVPTSRLLVDPIEELATHWRGAAARRTVTTE